MLWLETAVYYHAGQYTTFLKNICMHLYGSRHADFSPRISALQFPYMTLMPASVQKPLDQN